MKNSSLIFFLILIACICSCKKYDDGPVLSLRTKKSRIVGNWTLKTQEQDGLSTQLLTIEKLDINKDGTFKFTYKSAISNQEEGNWSFTSDKENIDFKFSCCTNRYKILRLKNKELWLENTVFFTNTNSIVTEYHYEQ